MSIYTRALVNRKANPKVNIFFLSFIPIRTLIKNNNTHIAQGLNPSINPIITEADKIDIFFKLTFFHDFTIYLLII